ncbi:MAG TPA: TIGR03619 family F420-dependent LLM class oxidoreductase, partial [Polyangiales bacterium]|nr:TIGR03619 family F420-dependent LLM class oxidoreductase [Polyangiales bacterium]
YPFEDGRGLVRLAQLLEASGVDSLWQTDRLVSSEPFLETISAMALLAGATERMRFGMNAVVASFRDPLLLAKQCATIDYLSGGRLLPVFGIGSDEAPEWHATGRDPRRRGARADEMLALMQRLWSEEKVDFAGEFFRYQQCTIAPRPVQQPLPCWIGGHSAAAIRRTARYGTGWLAGLRTPEQVTPIVARIKAELVVAARTIDADHYGAGFGFRLGSWDDPEAQRVAYVPRSAPPGFEPRAYFAVGDADAIVARCAEYVAAGISKFVLIPIARGEADVMRQCRRLIDEVIPRVQALPPAPATAAATS